MVTPLIGETDQTLKLRPPIVGMLKELVLFIVNASASLLTLVNSQLSYFPLQW